MIIIWIYIIIFHNQNISLHQIQSELRQEINFLGPILTKLSGLMILIIIDCISSRSDDLTETLIAHVVCEIYYPNVSSFSHSIQSLIILLVYFTEIPLAYRSHVISDNSVLILHIIRTVSMALRVNSRQIHFNSQALYLFYHIFKFNHCILKVSYQLIRWIILLLIFQIPLWKISIHNEHSIGFEFS